MFASKIKALYISLKSLKDQIRSNVILVGIYRVDGTLYCTEFQKKNL